MKQAVESSKKGVVGKRGITIPTMPNSKDSMPMRTSIIFFFCGFFFGGIFIIRCAVKGGSISP